MFEGDPKLFRLLKKKKKKELNRKVGRLRKWDYNFR